MDGHRAEGDELSPTGNSNRSVFSSAEGRGAGPGSRAGAVAKEMPPLPWASTDPFSDHHPHPPPRTGPSASSAWAGSRAAWPSAWVLELGPHRLEPSPDSPFGITPPCGLGQAPPGAPDLEWG